jgi:hypothetical protein
VPFLKKAPLKKKKMDLKIVGYSKWLKIHHTKLVLCGFLRLFLGTQYKYKVPLYAAETKYGFEIGDLVTTIRLNRLPEFKGVASLFECAVVK